MTTLELCERAELKEDVRKLALPDAPVRVFVQQLARDGQQTEAIAALAQLLPNRGCISWGLNSVRKVSATSNTPHAGPAFQAVEKWLADPTDELRRAAFEAGKRADLGTPAGALALAVFFSGGTMAPAEAPVAPIEPAPHLCAKVVALAMTAAVAWDPRNAAELRGAFLDAGFHLADQFKIWEAEK
jgi:hypothetical protein